MTTPHKKLAVLKTRRPFDSRVLGTPDMLQKLEMLGIEVHIQSGAGAGIHIEDAAYAAVGGHVEPWSPGFLQDKDIILALDADWLRLDAVSLKPGSTLVSILAPARHKPLLEYLAAQKVNALSLDLIPRISRAQSMDVLSSQSNLAGYKAVLEAATLSTRVFPMLMTAAGTIFPAKVLIIGAGVAGLQAIATAKRLGAAVTAIDVRAAAKEQVESLGAEFLSLESENLEDAGGYAREVTADVQKQLEQTLSRHLPKFDVVITTAQIPSRPAPVLITEKMVQSMRPGSVIVDLSIETGGNCTLSEASMQPKTHHGVQILAPSVPLAGVAPEATKLLARNVLTFLTALWEVDQHTLSPTKDPEIWNATCVVSEGVVKYTGPFWG